jgi:hypothetical protein
MVALLSASRVPVRRSCHPDACPLRNLFTAEMLVATEVSNPRARYRPGTRQLGSVWLGRRYADSAGLGDVSRRATLSECWHSVYRAG